MNESVLRRILVGVIAAGLLAIVLFGALLGWRLLSRSSGGGEAPVESPSRFFGIYSCMPENLMDDAAYGGSDAGVYEIVLTVESADDGGVAGYLEYWNVRGYGTGPSEAREPYAGTWSGNSITIGARRIGMDRDLDVTMENGRRILRGEGSSSGLGWVIYCLESGDPTTITPDVIAPVRGELESIMMGRLSGLLGKYLAIPLIGIFLMGIAGIWIVVLAFGESIGWGLLCLFVGPASIVFAFLHLDRCKIPLILTILGALLFASFFCIPG